VPPAATTGRSTAATTSRTTCGAVDEPSYPAGAVVAEWPPADPACAISASGPVAAARRASAALVTVTNTLHPARRNAATTAASGTPKVKLTSGTAAPTAMVTLAAKWSSSSSRSWGSATPYRCASGCRARRYSSSGATSAGPGDGTKMFNPNGSRLARSSATSCATASGDLYPAARNPTAPAAAAAVTNAGVDGPPAIGATMIGRWNPHTIRSSCRLRHRTAPAETSSALVRAGIPDG
jgi:hypothetical protein